MDTKKIKNIFFGVLGLAVLGFFLPVIVAIAASGEAMNMLGVCGPSDWHCVILAAIVIAVAIIIIGLIVTGLLFAFSYIVYLFKWKKFITPIENIDSRGKKYITAKVENRENQPTKFYCVLKSIMVNGSLDTDLKNHITEHTSRVSWSGGSNDGQEGVKNIDGKDKGHLNIVSRTERGLVFEMTKGEIPLGIKIGVFTLNLELWREISQGYSKTPFEITFEGYHETPSFSEGEQNQIRTALATITQNTPAVPVVYRIRLVDTNE